jgi:hypothetical protein
MQVPGQLLGKTVNCFRLQLHEAEFTKQSGEIQTLSV